MLEYLHKEALGLLKDKGIAPPRYEKLTGDRKDLLEQEKDDG